MKNIKIGTKLIGTFFIIAAIMGFLSFYLEQIIEHMDEQDTRLFEQGIIPLTLLITSVEHMQEIRVYLREWKLARSNNGRNEALKEIGHAYETLSEAIAKQIPLTQSEEVKQSLRNYNNSVDRYFKEMTNFMKTAKIDQATGMCLEDFPDALNAAAAEVTKLTEANVESKTKATEQLSASNTAAAEGAIRTVLIVIPIVVIASILIGLFLTFSITGPLNKVVHTLSEIEKGDMTVRAHLDRGDELGMLSNALDSLSTKLQSIFRNLRQDSDMLASSAEELSSVGKQVSTAAEENVSQCATVASTSEQAAVNINAMANGAEEASANANEVASAAEQMSTNMNTIAAAIEEMSASISEISNNAGDAKNIAQEATVRSKEATDAMNKLGEAAREIGQVTDVIKKIADKTNLLALNATIEAASAGEAGKGFAVVASEIKELANQSAASAEDIAKRVNGIQTGTGEAVEVIKDVSDIITKINHTVESISAHVGQQTKASNEIASNVAQANTGSKRVAAAIGEVAKGGTDIARNASEAARSSTVISQSVTSITQGTKDSAQGAKQINQSSSELARLSSELKKVLSQFKV